MGHGMSISQKVCDQCQGSVVPSAPFGSHGFADKGQEARERQAMASEQKKATPLSHQAIVLVQVLVVVAMVTAELVLVYPKVYPGYTERHIQGVYKGISRVYPGQMQRYSCSNSSSSSSCCCCCCCCCCCWWWWC